MKKLIVAACCFLLAGCASDNLPGTAGPSPMDSGAQNYAPGLASGSEARSVEEPITTTCTMRGQSAVCH